MKDTETFGECLKKFMHIFNMRGSVLARGINVDSSLVYRWLRDERVPAYSSPYVDLIIDYFSKCIINSYQHKNVIKALMDFGYIVTEQDLPNSIIAIRTCLLESQGYSIENCVNRKNTKKRDSTSNIDIQPKILDMPIEINNNKPTPPDPISTYHLPQDNGNVKVIEGNIEILNSMMSLLKSAPQKTDNNDDSIIITMNNIVHPIDYSNEYNAQWKLALFELLNKGWTINILIRLNNDTSRIIKIIQDMQYAISSGKYNIYYSKKAFMYPINEVIIIPNWKVLYCFSSKIKTQVDCAFLSDSKRIIKLMSGHFSQYFTSAKPLFHAYPSQMTMEYQQKFAEVEESLGDRYAFIGNISIITIPKDLYEKYLRMAGKSEQEITLRMIYHERRLEAFKNQIKYFKYKDICFKESIEQLVHKKKYPFDQYYMIENSTPDNKDIAYHLENVIDMLEKNANYEIALVSKKDYENVFKTVWMVKEDNSIFIETFNPNAPHKSKLDNYDSEINLHISEKNVINAFQDYFLMIWNEIGYFDKQKKEVIKWLRSNIDVLKAQDHEKEVSFPNF